MKNPKSKVEIWIWDFGNNFFNLCLDNNHFYAFGINKHWFVFIR